MPDVTKIIAFEQGELDDSEVDELFQELVDTGLAWKLQGFYGRTAVDLIEAERVRCPHSRGATDLDSGAWHCYICGAYVQGQEPGDG